MSTFRCNRTSFKIFFKADAKVKFKTCADFRSEVIEPDRMLLSKDEGKKIHVYRLRLPTLAAIVDRIRYCPYAQG